MEPTEEDIFHANIYDDLIEENPKPRNREERRLYKKEHKKDWSEE